MGLWCQLLVPVFDQRTLALLALWLVWLDVKQVNHEFSWLCQRDARYLCFSNLQMQ